jgi:hypothetical protein
MSSERREGKKRRKETGRRPVWPVHACETGEIQACEKNARRDEVMTKRLELALWGGSWLLRLAGVIEHRGDLVRFEHALWVGERASEGVRVTAINDLMGKHVESHVSDKTCRREEIRRETGLTKICPLTQEAIEGEVAKDQISGRSKEAMSVVCEWKKLISHLPNHAYS